MTSSLKAVIGGVLMALLSSVNPSIAESWTDFVSGAPAATVPLAAVDLLAVVQGGVTKKVPGNSFAPMTGGLSYYLSTTGSDSNSCMSVSAPCATIQHVINLCPNGGLCGITVSPGVYQQKAVATYYKVIDVSGPLDGSGNCINPVSVIFDDRVNGVATAGNIFDAEDHVIMVYNCLSVAAYAPGSVGFHTRQFAISDGNNIEWIDGSGNASWTGVAVAENSKFNLVNPRIFGGLITWGTASDSSQLIVSGTITNNTPVMSSYFLNLSYNAIADFTGVSGQSGGTITGPTFNCVNAILKGHTNVPGDAPPTTSSCVEP